jgi:hypothetical protein
MSALHPTNGGGSSAVAEPVRNVVEAATDNTKTTDDAFTLHLHWRTIVAALQAVVPGTNLSE